MKRWDMEELLLGLNRWQQHTEEGWGWLHLVYPFFPALPLLMLIKQKGRAHERLASYIFTGL